MDTTTRELLARARKDIADLSTRQMFGPCPDMIALGRASDTLARLNRFLGAKKPGDTVAVELPVNLVRALTKWIGNDRPYSALADMDPTASWEQIDEAISDALLTYDGPDGEDGRAFEDAPGKPHHEP